MIIVPTRYRAGKSATLAALQGRDYVLIATPADEVDAYAAAYPNTPVMEVPHGIGIARQVILEHMRLFGAPFWMLDDDITGAYGTTPHPDGTRRLHAVDIAEVVNGIEAVIAANGWERVAVAGPNWRHRAWSAPAIEEDRHVSQFVRIDPNGPANYWPHFAEDIEFCIKSILAGWHTYRINLFGFSSPQNGTLEGGCKPDYDNGAMEAGLSALAAEYPFVSTGLNNKTGLLKADIDWKMLDRMTT